MRFVREGDSMRSIVRIKKESNYVVMDKSFLNDTLLSWKAKGIMAYMLSKPDDWTFYIDELIKHATDGKSSFRSGFKELRDRGYVHRIQVRKDDGTFTWETIVYEQPHTDFPQVDNPSMEKPQVDNRTLLNNNQLSNKELSNDYIYTLFKYWNKKEIIKHRKMNQQMKSHTNARLQEYSFDELKKAIENYATILKGDQYYWTHKWTLQDFMKPNNVSRFVDEADPLTNFSKDVDKKGSGRKVARF